MNNQLPGATPALKEPQTGQLATVKGPEWNDRDRLNDLLATEKYLSWVYGVSLNEASHDRLHADLLRIATETHQLQRQVWKAMYDRGWYSMPIANAADVQQARQQFSSYQTQFGHPT